MRPEFDDEELFSMGTIAQANWAGSNTYEKWRAKEAQLKDAISSRKLKIGQADYYRKQHEVATLKIKFNLINSHSFWIDVGAQSTVRSMMQSIARESITE